MTSLTSELVVQVGIRGTIVNERDIKNFGPVGTWRPRRSPGVDYASSRARHLIRIVFSPDSVAAIQQRARNQPTSEFGLSTAALRLVGSGITSGPAMNKILSGVAFSLFVCAAAQSASAADMAVKAAPKAADPMPNWTGLYVGLNAGGGWGSDPVTYTPLYTAPPVGFPAFAAANGSPTLHPAGFVGGAQIGYNWQSGNWLLGLEADADFARLARSTNTGVLNFPAVAPFQIATAVGTQWLVTVRPRLGYVVGRGLVYVTGGAAFSDLQLAQTVIFAGPSIATGSTQVTRAGWTAGGGIEYSLASHWSAKVEYLHADFGSVGFAALVNNPVINSTSSARFRMDIVRAGLNYHFAGP